ncbi:response regulator transcription factor [Konateibacter massiliensis]|uniref:response regulator transcription factor n=1 Tax=Konateibacter massiliensis TaxID=2002841 RepID=UPI000C148166|nr:helix-turn-helix domain-containing protein [Konateibacter massiliensis]
MYKVIVIDDEEKIREGIVNLFPWESIGFEIAGSFSNGREALDWLKQKKTDVVLTDIEMPGMDGITLSSHLSETGTKVVYFSSYHTFEYAKSAIRNRVVDYLVKPIKYDELTECFERIKQMLDEENTLADTDKEDETLVPPSYYATIIQHTAEYLKASYREATLEDAARQVHLSSSYLSRLFKEKVGMNFSDYLMKVRMEKAKELLGDISYKQYEIAYRVGYDNPKNFSRAFKTYFGVSPKEYRNHSGVEEAEQL